MLACGGVRRYPNCEIVVRPRPALPPTELPPTVVGRPRGAIDPSRLRNRRFAFAPHAAENRPYAHTVRPVSDPAAIDDQLLPHQAYPQPDRPIGVYLYVTGITTPVCQRDRA